MAGLLLESYALALLKVMGKRDDAEHPPLGFARRSGTLSSNFNVPAHKLLQAVIEYSPSPETIARGFLVELGKCGILAVKGFVDALDNDRSVNSDDWAAIVHEELEQNNGNTTYLTELASYYLSHLIIAFRNPGGKKTPQYSVHPTPNLRRIEDIALLLESATAHRSQSALRDLVFLRDGTRCSLTRYAFLGDDRVVVPRCAHIIPFSIHSKTDAHAAIETFTGQTLNAELIQQLVNHPANAINIQTDAHDSMDQKLAWGIEANLVDHKWNYYFRVVRPKEVAATIYLRDGDEMKFGQGIGGDEIPLPDPRICNLHLAVARVFAASGAAEVFDKYLEDDDDDYMTQVPVYFGGPFVDDDVLMRKLEVLAT
ncbi:uncharacterized protein EI90DRAFT_3123066 [Cantharellus anzutake]|uniref:uncharacterized protein n=1 Tax=Cantharellus anzutake TaxID=1750568 RepID=UPI00190343FD|nr:uncharacterized protein EI90DRAFT_3123066 [Cantharellus anzutake]KAF8331973.1 hypothetical protein EI90DRAFT_3123066 [Cantharellus anzutake]